MLFIRDMRNIWHFWKTNLTTFSLVLMHIFSFWKIIGKLCKSSHKYWNFHCNADISYLVSSIHPVCMKLKVENIFLQNNIAVTFTRENILQGSTFNSNSVIRTVLIFASRPLHLLSSHFFYYHIQWRQWRTPLNWRSEFQPNY